MRRTWLVVVVTALVSTVTSLTVAVAWGGTRAGSPSGDGSLDTKLPIVFDTRVDCGVPPRGSDWPNQDALEDSVRCLEREIVNVNRFMRYFFSCTRISEVTQYGEAPRGGTFGYVWDNGDDTPTFLTTALNYTIDPATDPFKYFMLWQNNERCVF
jgi:hypothetical protein